MINWRAKLASEATLRVAHHKLDSFAAFGDAKFARNDGVCRTMQYPPYTQNDGVGVAILPQHRYTTPMTQQTTRLSPEDTARWRQQQKRKNWAILLALLGFVALVFLLTFTKMKNNVAEREKQQAIESAIQGMEIPAPASTIPQTPNPKPQQ